METWANKREREPSQRGVTHERVNQARPVFGITLCLHIGLPREGEWKVRLNADWSGYSADFGNLDCPNVTARREGRDGHPQAGSVRLAPYSAIILSQEP